MAQRIHIGKVEMNNVTIWLYGDGLSLHSAGGPIKKAPSLSSAPTEASGEKAGKASHELDLLSCPRSSDLGMSGRKDSVSRTRTVAERPAWRADPITDAESRAQT
ncbi:hypothetical protein WOLCODRAFT_144429 [Wolfiporia cocos MD-104 SS10]|uniref:Uncharacterized protein n=1 Tax=Wolfiporia cocos (strain MD-104) TaxID=742152 RepID=A0A2H3JWC3_WOLCO|nr:hypothetical protein WOLCODRAFT_144429 [Wolfiporia cocos MD-104 SS10]